MNLLKVTFLILLVGVFGGLGCKGNAGPAGATGPTGPDGLTGPTGPTPSIIEFIGVLPAGDSVLQLTNVGSSDVVLPYWELSTDTWILLADSAGDALTDTWATFNNTTDRLDFFNMPRTTRYKVLIIDDVNSSRVSGFERLKGI